MSFSDRHTQPSELIGVEGGLLPKSALQSSNTSALGLRSLPDNSSVASVSNLSLGSGASVTPAWFAQAIEGLSESLSNQIMALRREDHKTTRFDHEFQNFESKILLRVQAKLDSMEPPPPQSAILTEQPPPQHLVPETGSPSQCEEKSLQFSHSQCCEAVTSVLPEALQPLMFSIQRVEALLGTMTLVTESGGHGGGHGGGSANSPRGHGRNPRARKTAASSSAVSAGPATEREAHSGPNTFGAGLAPSEPLPLRRSVTSQSSVVSIAARDFSDDQKQTLPRSASSQSSAVSSAAREFSETAPLQRGTRRSATLDEKMEQLRGGKSGTRLSSEASSDLIQKANAAPSNASVLVSNRWTTAPSCDECGTVLSVGVTKCPNCDAEVEPELSLLGRCCIWCSQTALVKAFETYGIEPDEKTLLARIVTNHWFEMFCSLVIMCNALFIGYSQNYAITHLTRQKNYFIGMVELSFVVFYVGELALKIVVHRMYFVFGIDWKWNFFDAMLILSALWDQVQAVNSGLLDQASGDSGELNARESGGPGGSSVVFLRLVRLLKLGKIFRVFRVMKAFHELRILLFSIVNSFRSLFWVITLLALILYIFALIFVQAATDYLAAEPSAETEVQLREYYGSTYRAMDSLFQAITGGADWSDLAAPLKSLPTPESPLTYYILFVLYVFFLFFAVLNILTGIFVDNAMKCSRQDSDTMIHEQQHDAMALHNDMLKVFTLLDEDHKGTVNIIEFSKRRNHPHVEAYFKHLDLDINAAEDFLATLAGVSEGGEVGFADFMEGCRRMKGSAKRADFVALSLENKKIIRALDCFKEDSERQSKALQLVSSAMEELLQARAEELGPQECDLGTSSRECTPRGGAHNNQSSGQGRGASPADREDEDSHPSCDTEAAMERIEAAFGGKTSRFGGETSVANV